VDQNVAPRRGAAVAGQARLCCCVSRERDMACAKRMRLNPPAPLRPGLHAGVTSRAGLLRADHGDPLYRAEPSLSPGSAPLTRNCSHPGGLNDLLAERLGRARRREASSSPWSRPCRGLPPCQSLTTVRIRKASRARQNRQQARGPGPAWPQYPGQRCCTLCASVPPRSPVCRSPPSAGPDRSPKARAGRHPCFGSAWSATCAVASPQGLVGQLNAVAETP